MHRRLVLAFPLVAASITSPLAMDHMRRVSLDATVFSWRHEGERLFGEITAPARGWMAVGFNDKPGLPGTRFVIGVAGPSEVRAEWHIANPPNHQRVETLGGRSDIRDLAGKRDNGRSTLSFSLPHRGTDRFAIDLTPGRSVHLMLAWSNEPEFTHHSVWRRHTDVIL